jgi:hypothetical protein
MDPSGRPVSSGVKLREIMCSEPATKGPAATVPVTVTSCFVRDPPGSAACCFPAAGGQIGTVRLKAQWTQYARWIPI